MENNTGLLAPQYRDEDAAREYIEKQRWPNGPECPHCGLVNEARKITAKPDSKSPTRKGVWKCLGCSKQFTVTVDSIFSDSHIPLHKWLLAIHLIASSKKGVSAHQLMRNLEIGSYRTAWFMAHRIRWVLTQEPVKAVFDGIVEVDETYIGGKAKFGPHATKPGERPKDRPAPFAGKAAVVSVLQRGGSVRSHHVERVTSKTLRPIIEQMVSENAHLMTDDSSVLKSAGKNRRHSQVNHRAKEYVRREGAECITTNSVEGYFALVKRGNFGVYHHWSKKYLGQYLREFDWRYNVRKLEDMERVIVALKMTGGKRLVLKAPSEPHHNY
jgi:transposase-like protein